MLVHATGGNYLTEFRVSPSNPPDRSIVLALDLEGTNPLIRQKHLVDLLGYFRA